MCDQPSQQCSDPKSTEPIRELIFFLSFSNIPVNLFDSAAIDPKSPSFSSIFIFSGTSFKLFVPSTQICASYITTRSNEVKKVERRIEGAWSKHHLSNKKISGKRPTQTPSNELLCLSFNFMKAIKTAKCGSETIFHHRLAGLAHSPPYQPPLK